MRVTLIAVQSLDGFITRHDTPGAGFASSADQAHFRAVLREFDCCVMGRVTHEIAQAQPILPTSLARRRVVLTRVPEKFVRQAVPGVLEFTSAPPAEIVTRLRADGVQACALLGGAQAHSRFLAAGVVDELWLTVEPQLFGAGTPLLEAQTEVRLKLLACEPLGEDVLLLKYAVRR
jgi:dihydrofolate reductase